MYSTDMFHSRSTALPLWGEQSSLLSTYKDNRALCFQKGLKKVNFSSLH